MLASPLPMRYARIWQMRNGKRVKANERGNRELPMTRKKDQGKHQKE